MNKKLIMAALSLTIATASCTQNEVEDINVTTSETIALNPSTSATRAIPMALDSLKHDMNGFAVYATGGLNPGGWYSNGGLQVIDGTNNHYWRTSVTPNEWQFKTQVPWPAVGSTSYPMKFYAFYPTYPNAAVTSLNNAGSYLSANVSIPTDVKKQVDMLAGYSSTPSKPISGNLYMDFKHILSKVNFTVSNMFGPNNTTPVANTTQNAYVLSLGFANLYQQNTYNYMPATGTTTGAWNPLNTGSIRVDYNYYNSFVGLSGAQKYSEKRFNSATNASFMTSVNVVDSNLMLLPQNPQVWNTSSTPVNVPATGDAYVKMLYRVEETSPLNNDFIGFKDASSHLSYPGSALQAKGYTGPLYVLVGYTYAQTWAPGKGYTYNIPIPGVSGGRLLDECLYDDQANRTDLKVPGGKVPDVVIGGDGYIHLDPIVTPWDEINQGLN